MRSLMLFAVLLVSDGLGAPLTELRDLDKRRESTQEILNLEQQLKTAAGENKKTFSADEARPSPQIDGLDTDFESEINEAIPQSHNEPVMMPVDQDSMDDGDVSDLNNIPVQMQEEEGNGPIAPMMHDDVQELNDVMDPNVHAINDVMDPEAVNDEMDDAMPNNAGSYEQMWKLFQEHPEYFGDFLQDKEVE